MMTGSDILRQVKENRNPRLCFIKWWRKEQDFLNFEEIDEFIQKARPDEEFEGYELLDMEQVWAFLRERELGNIHRETRTSGREVIVWNRPGKSQECPFNPASLMTILNVESRGTVID
ncbi:MAG TPA: hypothetical protein VGA43_07210 [Deferrimonas sp.]|jgi:hypothetical protein